MADSSAAARWIEENLGHGSLVKQRGGSSSGWSSTCTMTAQDGTSFFVKTARGRDEGMFIGEQLGLNAMYDTGTIRVPRVFHVGTASGSGGALKRADSYIIMEYLDFGGSASQQELGRQLARMHLADPKDENARQGMFGFPVDNTIGGTPQPNGWMDNWVAFYRERRLRHQLQLAGDSKLSKLGAKLLDNLEVFFEGAGPIRPCVLHGDLWSGNIASVDGQPAIFDPATYYGHHEAEFGMSWCAGFSDAFYRAYHELIPRAPGFEDRRQLYLLYHYLNHLNLFGSGYYGQCQSIMERLVSRL